jgi:hypothetical protein
VVSNSRCASVLVMVASIDRLHLPEFPTSGAWDTRHHASSSEIDAGIVQGWQRRVS